VVGEGDLTAPSTPSMPHLHRDLTNGASLRREEPQWKAGQASGPLTPRCLHTPFRQRTGQTAAPSVDEGLTDPVQVDGAQVGQVHARDG
jgi:hypothetical protein